MAGTPYEEKKYVQSDAVTQAHQALQNQQAAKPGEYQSQWQGQLNDVLGQIQNRDKFQYDINADALYQQAAQRYIQQGKQAMMDTMGQAAAMTGGYGNSYAQTAGQQTYQNYLLGLTDMIPQFQQMAMQQYQMEGDDLLNRYSLLAQQEESAYGRYNDMLSRYYAELDRLQGVYDSERDYDYSRFADDRDFDYGRYMDDLNYQYQLDRDKAEDDRWLQQWQYQQERDRIADEQWQKEFDEAKRQYDQTYAMQQAAAAAKSSGGSGGGGGGGYNYDTHGMSTAEIKALQKELGVSADGIWGPKTEAAYQAKYGGSNNGGNGGATVDLKSVIDLGYGPISGDTLSGLVASGKVTATQQGNKIVVSNNDTKPTIGTGLASLLPSGYGALSGTSSYLNRYK